MTIKSFSEFRLCYLDSEGLKRPCSLFGRHLTPHLKIILYNYATGSTSSVRVLLQLKFEKTPYSSSQHQSLRSENTFVSKCFHLENIDKTPYSKPNLQCVCLFIFVMEQSNNWNRETKLTV